MSERRASYMLSHPEEQGQAPTFILPEPIDLGQHILEVRVEDQTVVVFKKTGGNSQVQLDKEEAYRLLVTLQWVFQQEMEREKEAADSTENRE